MATVNVVILEYDDILGVTYPTHPTTGQLQNQQGVRFIRGGNQVMSIPMNTFSGISLPTCLDELGDTGPMSTKRDQNITQFVMIHPALNCVDIRQGL